MEINRWILRPLWLHEVFPLPHILYSVHFQKDYFAQNETDRYSTCLITSAWTPRKPWRLRKDLSTAQLRRFHFWSQAKEGMSRGRCRRSLGTLKTIKIVPGTEDLENVMEKLFFKASGDQHQPHPGRMQEQMWQPNKVKSPTKIMFYGVWNSEFSEIRIDWLLYSKICLLTIISCSSWWSIYSQTKSRSKMQMRS